MRTANLSSTGRVLLTIAALWMSQGSALASPIGLAPHTLLKLPIHALLKHLPPLRIIAFGSSSTEGVGASRPSATYPAQLQADLDTMVPQGRDVEVLNRGIGGEDADDMAKRLQADVISRHPELVIWQTGSNDPMRHVPLDRFERETRDGITAMRKAGIDVILMEPQWCPRLETVGTSDQYRDMVRRIGSDMKVEVIRRSDLMHQWIRQGLLTRAQMLAADGLHMTDGGYALLARSVAPEVLKVEDITPAGQAITPVVAASDVKGRDERP